MPDGASSQDKLFSHSQSGETLGQSKSHHHIPSHSPHASLSKIPLAVFPPHPSISLLLVQALNTKNMRQSVPTQ